MARVREYGAYAIARPKATGDECIPAEMLEERLDYVETDSEMALMSRRPVQPKMLVA